MRKKQMVLLKIIMVLVFSISFCFGIFLNPNFNIYDFCMNLSSEIIGVVIVILLIDNYTLRKKAEQNKEEE